MYSKRQMGTPYIRICDYALFLKDWNRNPESVHLSLVRINKYRHDICILRGNIIMIRMH